MTQPAHDRWRRVDDDRQSDALPPSQFGTPSNAGTPHSLNPTPQPRSWSEPRPAPRPVPRPQASQWTTKPEGASATTPPTSQWCPPAAPQTTPPTASPAVPPTNRPSPLTDNRIMAGVLGGLALITLIAHFLNWYSGSVTLDTGFGALRATWKSNGFGSGSSEGFGGIADSSTTSPLLMLLALLVLALLTTGTALQAFGRKPVLGAALPLAAGIIELLLVMFGFLVGSQLTAESAMGESDRAGIDQYVSTSSGAGIFLALPMSLALITISITLLVAHHRTARKAQRPQPPSRPVSWRS